MSVLSEPGATGNKSLVIKAKGGLGNRMLSAVTGLVLAALNNRQPFVDWRDGMYVAPGENLYPLLFDASWMGDLSRFDECVDVEPSIWSGRMTDQPTDVIKQHFPNQHQDPLLYRKLSIDLAGKDPDAEVGVFWSYLPKLKRLRRRLSGDPRFSSSELATTRDMLDRYFQPVGPVREKVDTLFSGIDGPVIGVHIRFTDRKAPMPKIIAKLRRLHREMPDATIFLATDSAAAQSKIFAEFPKTLSIDKAMAQGGEALHVATGQFEDPVAEARNALIDMLALSRCDRLLHSGHSTFSVTAALLGKIARNKQVDVDRFNPRVVLKQFIQARV